MKGKHHLTFLRLKGHLAVYALDQPRPVETLYVCQLNYELMSSKRFFQRNNLIFTCLIIRYFFKLTIKFLPSATDTTGNALCAVVRSMRITEDTRETIYT